jgi:hypothetical protein
MRARRVVVVFAMSLATFVVSDSTVFASEVVGGGAYVDDDDDPGATANDGGVLTGGGASGSGDDDGCVWRVLISDDAEVAVYGPDGERLYSETGRWLAEVCDTDNLLSPIGGVLAPEGGLVDPLDLALEARDTVPIAHPSIHTSPDGDRRLYTQVPTWFWVDDSWWQPYTVTVTAGRVTTTLTATPTRAHWDAGDGERVTCEGPGVTWRPGMSDDDTYCKHTYRHSSAGRSTGTYPLTVTIEFSIGWTSNVGQTGSLAGVTRTATREVEVGEIQAVES